MKDRRTTRPERPMQVQTPGEKSGKILNREIQAKIGQQLRAVYNGIVDQGVPDRFADLLRRLDDGMKEQAIGDSQINKETQE
jgi:hypothetical protein